MMAYEIDLLLEPLVERDSGFTHPCLIRILVFCGKDAVHEVLSVKWGAELLSNWLQMNRGSILTETIPQELPKDESLASAIAEFYRTVAIEDEVVLDRIFAYRERHGLRFALRGTDVPDIYLGKNSLGFDEISCNDSGNSWAYRINLEDFLNRANTAFDNCRLPV